MAAPAQTDIQFGADGLVPVVVQDTVTGDVLMVAFMNEEALRLTRETKRAHFWSRGRQRLWRKGETSGHEQIVDEIRINCERNSVLLQVRQVGAVCHDGYDTCYYRRLENDDSLTLVRQRVFDPAAIYGAAPVSSPPEQIVAEEPLALATRRQYGAYAFLRDEPLERLSSTSRRLRDPGEPLAPRLADELVELAGVIDGQHRHVDFTHDLILEASQVVYWALGIALRERLTWARLRPDTALATADHSMPADTAAALLRAEAKRWSTPEPPRDLAASLHATLALVGQACRVGGVDPLTVIETDLADLASRPYLAAFFNRDATRDEPTV